MISDCTLFPAQPVHVPGAAAWVAGAGRSRQFILLFGSCVLLKCSKRSTSTLSFHLSSRSPYFLLLLKKIQLCMCQIRAAASCFPGPMLSTPHRLSTHTDTHTQRERESGLKGPFIFITAPRPGTLWPAEGLPGAGVGARPVPVTREPAI